MALASRAFELAACDARIARVGGGFGERTTKRRPRRGIAPSSRTARRRRAFCLRERQPRQRAMPDEMWPACARSRARDPRGGRRIRPLLSETRSPNLTIRHGTLNPRSGRSSTRNVSNHDTHARVAPLAAATLTRAGKRRRPHHAGRRHGLTRASSVTICRCRPE